MEKEIQIIAKIDGINQGAHFCNITVQDDNDRVLNIKLDHEQLSLVEIGKAYVFNVEKKILEEKDKEVLEYKSSDLIENVLSIDLLDKLLPKFYNYAPLSPNVIRNGIEGFLNKIENPIYKEIAQFIYDEHKDIFYVHPAATKFHHSYVGGLSHHTYSMLKLIDTFIEVYNYLDKDLLYASAILHDIKKIDEITNVDGTYTTEGQLIGHIVMGTIDIDRVARKLDYENTEEVLLLKHTILSHHGQLNYGSPKRPQIGEALLLWYLDTIDSKLGTLGDVLESTKPGEFTTNIPVLDRMRFYKKK